MHWSYNCLIINIHVHGYKFRHFKLSFKLSIYNIWHTFSILCIHNKINLLQIFCCLIHSQTFLVLFWLIRIKIYYSIVTILQLKKKQNLTQLINRSIFRNLITNKTTFNIHFSIKCFTKTYICSTISWKTFFFKVFLMFVVFLIVFYFTVKIHNTYNIYLQCFKIISYI